MIATVRCHTGQPAARAALVAVLLVACGSATSPTGGIAPPTSSPLALFVLSTLEEAEQRLAASQLPVVEYASLFERLAELRRQLAAMSPDDWSTAAAEYPMNDVHAGALRVIGSIEELTGAPPLRAWATNLWDPLDMTSVPAPNGGEPLQLIVANGEIRSAALNVRNSTPHDTEISIDLRDVDALQAGWLRVRSVAWTGATDIRAVATAMVPTVVNGGRCSVKLPAGVTRQIWLTFSPTRVPGASHERELRITSTDGEEAILPVSIRVLPGAFARKPPLHIAGWDYLNDPGGMKGTPEYLDRIASLLREYGVDIPWATGSVMSFGRFDSRGKMTEPPDTSTFDRWVARWPHAFRYRVFVSAGDTIGQFRRGSPAFRAAVSGWAAFWATHAATRGIPADEVDLLLVDEPRQSAQSDCQTAWAVAVRGSGAGFRVWLDPLYSDPGDIPQELVDTADIVSVNWQFSERAGDAYWRFARRLPPAGKQVEIYATHGPVSTLDPYSYYRLLAWRAFDLGVSTISFWSFTDTGGGNSWRPYAAPRPVFSPLFLDGSTVYASKHLEAIREGVEDYAYLTALRDKIQEARARGIDTPLVSESETLLATVTARVLSASHIPDWEWSAPKDRSAADTARIQVAEMLERWSVEEAPTR